MKKWMKRLTWIAVCGVLAILLLDILLHFVSRTAWFNTRVRTFLERSINRDIKISKIGANLRGVVVTGFAAAEQGGFEKGTFLEAEHLRISFSLFHLLHAHAKVRQLTLAKVIARVSVNPDGTTSWADLLPATDSTPQKDPADKRSLHLTAEHIHLENLQFIYTDHNTAHTLQVEELTIGIANFSTRRPFSFYLQARLRPTLNGNEFLIPLVLRATVDLKEMNWEQARAQIHALSASYQKASVALTGEMENFENPQANLKITVRNLSNETLASIPAVPAFELDTATSSLKLAADLEKSALTVHNFTLQAPGLTAHAQGGLRYKDPQNIIYDATLESNWILGEMGRWLTALADPYRLVGTVNTELQITQKEIKGDISFKGIGGEVPQAGNVSDLDAAFKLQEAMDLLSGKLSAKMSGKLNGRPFEMSATAKQTPQKIDAVLTAKAEEVMFRLPEEAQNQPADTTAETAPQKPWPLAPINIKTDIQLGKVDVPYFYGNDVSFSTEMEGITPDLKQAHGTLRLQTGAGKIQDIYKLTNATPITKVLFLSLDITGKVFNALNVFDVLGSIGGGISSAVTTDKDAPVTVKTKTILGPDGEPLEINVVETDKKVSGEMEYDKFDTEVNFVKGLATIKEGTFVSPVMSFRLDGTTDFNTQQIDMTVHAAPGRHEVDGMMPLALKIGGTIDNPQGDMQLLGSVTSLVTQSVTKNVVSRQVGKGIKGFFGLFKKDKVQTPEPPETNPGEAQTTQTND